MAAAIMAGKRAAAGQRVDTLVVGLGATGLACARHLVARGETVAVVDSRREPPGLAALREELPSVPVWLGVGDDAQLPPASRIVSSPGVAPTWPPLARAQAAGVPVDSDIDLFADAATRPVVAVTGSNGKSTVTTLVAEMLCRGGRRALAGGNLGRPALELLRDPAPECYVLELSSFQLERCSRLAPAAAALLNLAADHLDRHGDMVAYAAAKARIFGGDGVQVLNADDATVAAMARPARRTLYFSLSQPAADFHLLERDGEPWLAAGGEPLLAASEVRLAGRHNLANALAALALASCCGVALPVAAAVLTEFRGLPHRCQLVHEHGGVRWYDDSKATNAAAAAAAIGGLAASGPLVLLAGGVAKESDFSVLAAAARGRVREAVLFGRDRERLAAALRGSVTLTLVDDMPQAVERAARVARAGDAVLLAPACASFDQYRDYAERGRHFAALAAGGAAR